jgi:hypothetical protein
LRFLLGIGVGLFTLILAPPLGAQQKSLTAEEQTVVDTIRSIFVAAKADDMAKFNAIVVPGYYMFDNGMRFDGDAIMKLIGEAHAKGMRYDWNVTDPDVHISGNTAWVAYVNQGSITDAQGKETNVSWLESCILEKRDGVWRILFFHSTRVAPPKAAQSGQ